MGKGFKAALLALALVAAPVFAEDVAVVNDEAAASNCGPENFAAVTLTANSEGFLVLVMSGCAHDAVVKVRTLAIGNRFTIQGVGAQQIRVPSGRLVAAVVPTAVDHGMSAPSWMIDARVESVLAASTVPAPR